MSHIRFHLINCAISAGVRAAIDCPKQHTLKESKSIGVDLRNFDFKIHMKFLAAKKINCEFQIENRGNQKI